MVFLNWFYKLLFYNDLLFYLSCVFLCFYLEYLKNSITFTQ